MSQTFKKSRPINKRKNTYLKFMELGNSAMTFLEGMDFCGKCEDIFAFNERLDCDLYENIKNVEKLKFAINTEYIKHLNIAKEIFSSDFERKQLWKLAIFNYDFEKWLKHVKIFYFSILSDNYIFSQLKPYGICMSDIENVFNMLIQLDEYVIEQNEDRNLEWN